VKWLVRFSPIALAVPRLAIFAILYVAGPGKDFKRDHPVAIGTAAAFIVVAIDHFTP
jgi:hypothetical protein